MFSTARRRRARRGFTLVELMIVIAILGILAAILTPILIRARFKTYHTACVANERNLASALELYAVEERNLYPPSLNLLVAGDRPFIQSIENCPSNESSYVDTYTTNEAFTEYVLACPGIHEIQLNGVVQDTYPQVSNGAFYQNGPPGP